MASYRRSSAHADPTLARRHTWYVISNRVTFWLMFFNTWWVYGKWLVEGGGRWMMIFDYATDGKVACIL